MRIKKIQNKLEFDIEAQGNYECMHDCKIMGQIPEVVGLTWECISGNVPGHSCHVEVSQGIIGYGPITTEWF